MNFAAAQNKHLTHIEQTAKELLAILKADNLGDEVIGAQLEALISAAAAEQLLRVEAASRQVDNASKQLPTWDDEGGSN